MAIVRQIPWTEQPQTAAGVDWGNPLSQALSFAWNAFAPTIDVVSNSAGTISGGSTTGASTKGIAFSSSAGVSNGINFGSSYKPIKANSTNYTILSLAKPVPNGSGVRQTFWAQGDDGGSPFRQYTLMADGAGAGVGSIELQQYDGAVIALAYSNTLAVNNQWRAFVGRRSGSTADVFVDGKNATISSSGTYGVSVDTTGPTYVSGVSGQSRALVSGNALVLVWNRALSDAEIASVSANPWQLFAPRTQRIWTAASGGAYSITAQPGSYALSGQTSTITRSRLLTGSAGSYAVTGQNATVSRSRLITASAGAYAIAGQSATLVRSRLITAQAGAYTYTGQSATITYAGAGAYTLTALAGSYALTGQAATMTKSRVINASAGSYALAGKAASITYSGAPAPTGLSGVYFDVLSGRLLVLRSGT